MIQRYNRIFAALDDASTQDRIIDKALAVAAYNKAHLRFGHVVDSMPTDATGSGMAGLSEAVRTRITEYLVNTLDAQPTEDGGYVTTCSDGSQVNFDIAVSAGDVAATLEEQLIAPYNPDLVVCGERGLSNIRYAFLGSVSTYLIRHVSCDVLVVKKDS